MRNGAQSNVSVDDTAVVHRLDASSDLQQLTSRSQGNGVWECGARTYQFRPPNLLVDP